MSAKLGDNVATRSDQMPWYQGPTVLETLGRFRKETAGAPALRFPVQDVYKFDARRIIAGRVAAGQLRVGDRVVFFTPSHKSATDAGPSRASTWSRCLPRQWPGESVGVTLDEQIFIERGEVGTLPDSPPRESVTFRANLFWMGQRPLEMGRRYLLRLATQEVPCEVAEIHRIVDAADLMRAMCGMPSSATRLPS